MPKTTVLASEKAQVINANVEQSRYPVLVLDPKVQRLSGLEIIEVQPANYQPEFLAYGKALSIQPLLTLHHQYLQAIAESRSAIAKFTQSEQSIKRVQDLFSHGIASKRKLQEQQAQWRADKSLVDAAHFRIQAIADEARLNWGSPITEWITTAESAKLEPFLSSRQILLQIMLPSSRQFADNLDTIAVDAFGNRNKAQAARLISMAPKSDDSVQGISYFFQAQGKAIKAGMKICAWIAEKRNATEGVIVPKPAVIWAMDQAFVYIKTREDQFTRRMVKPVPSGSGYFLSETIKPGEYIVIAGGQMLLSEELRGQIVKNNE